MAKANSALKIISRMVRMTWSASQPMMSASATHARIASGTSRRFCHLYSDSEGVRGRVCLFTVIAVIPASELYRQHCDTLGTRDIRKGCHRDITKKRGHLALSCAGWGAGIRTPIDRSRVGSPTIERHPNLVH